MDTRPTIDVILLNDVDLHMPSRVTLAVYQNKISNLLKWNVMWFFASTLTWYHTDMKTQHIQGPIDWHTHKNMYQRHHLRANNSYVHYIEWIIRWYQIFTFHNFFAF